MYGTTGLNPVLVAVVYFVVGVAGLRTTFLLFRTRHDWLDVVLASGAAALLSLIPTVGDPMGLAAMLGILYWRIRQDTTAIAAAVMVARLLIIPVLLVFKLKLGH